MTIEKLMRKIKSYNPEAAETVKKAYVFAKQLHEGQYRQSGESYISHPLNVAYILAELGADGDTICAGLLHDTREDTCITREEIVEQFNEDVATLVEGVTKISGSSSDRSLINTRKIIMGITTDVRIIIIKLADRLHNMRTLQFKKLEKQKKIALETLEIFVPLANYLGVYRIKSELEDLSLRYYKPNVYFDIVEKLNKTKVERENLVKEMMAEVSEKLNEHNIKHEIKGRAKSVYSIYNKLCLLLFGNISRRHRIYQQRTV